MEEKKNKINKTKISVVLGIMCFALALGICIQIRTVKNSNSTVSSNYEENNLRAEVLKYKEKYDNKYKELEKAEEELEKERQNSTKDNSQLEEKEEQIKQGNKMIGLTEVTGPGVIVTLSDSKKDANSVLNPSTLLVHDVDILGVVNELKNAGAEAISINDQRIINMSDIVDINETFIKVNGQRILAPYVIKAIGNSSYLETALTGNGGHVDEMKKIGQNISIEKMNKVKILKYDGEIKTKYIQ